MEMEVDNSFTGAVFNLDLLANMEPLAGERSYQASNIVSDSGYYPLEELMPEVRMRVCF